MSRRSTGSRALGRVLLLAGALTVPLGLAPPATQAAPQAASPAGQAAPEGAAAEAPGDDPHAEPNGLKGEYFTMSEPGARDFAELGGVSLDPDINMPGLVTTYERMTGQSEHVTARWTGQLEVPETGRYTFYAIGDNGFRLSLDGEPVIDHWVGDWDVEQTSEPVTLEAGERYRFELEHFQDVGGANMYLRWSGPGIDKQLVPESAFHPPADYEVYPVATSVGETGETVRATFAGVVGNVAGLVDHVTIEADTTPMPIRSVEPAPDDPNAVLFTLDEPVLRDARVRFSYDGEAALTVAGEAVPEINRTATNRSTHRLLSEWGENLDPQNPLPEYPRPQLVRERWQNLNGPWQFAGAAEGEQPDFGEPLDEQIIVPFPVESQLSGLERHEDHMFYRKLVTVPDGWDIGSGQRLKLNFGAVDHRARVWVNGKLVAEHTGGYTAFSADITDALVPGGKQEIVVAVTDTTGTNQPIGKQSTDPGGIVYTQSSGIWQTVWMEPVSEVAVDKLVTTPNVDDGTLTVEVRSEGASENARVRALARDDRGRVAGVVVGRANTELELELRDPRLWSPDDPYLYDLEVTLRDGAASDTVDSYFGMRSVSIEEVGGFQKLVLNGEPIFSLAMLDQGFWPGGLHTAPSDEALRFDLEKQKELGFNAVRKHIKMEPARWYYHADKLGLLVWQDFVNATITNEKGREAFLTEGRRMMSQLHNSPSIVGWVVFNEGWGEWDREATGRIAESVKKADPSRIVNAHSGVNCCDSKGDSGKGDIIDHHDYLNDDPPFPDENRAAMDGEHGGFTLRTPGHMWPGPPADIYSGVADKEALTDKYVQNTEHYYLEAAGAELSGSVYTQITDLENELNGFWTYDRREIKVDPERVRAVNERVLAAGASAGEREKLTGGGYWRLDEGEGTTSADSGENGHTLSLTDGVEWVPGVSDSALSFDGNGQYAETDGPVLDTTRNYSVSAWVSLDELPGNYASAVSQDGRRVESPFYLQYGHGAFAFSIPGGQKATFETTPELGRWYHLTGVHDVDAGELRLYVDGQPAASLQTDDVSVSTGPLAIGRAEYDGGNTDFWNGAIDEVHAFDKALTDTEVAELYESERP
ncbi:glycosyl hydrolase family 2 [Haloactinopolyspora alba]|uniref:Glycosyl hydrolase family 2 n=1 Tax=Haloactinopolyspora alba TaxID=648780 RepID=A0A2P8E7I1_9ACTN|nr:LamG-like jellyroll fold domain-containing protein [Haloactinopolyspora alba]PSL05426.1 glycosyl hydrolase family 2 [Haloactinopolyspora alba]